MGRGGSTRGKINIRGRGRGGHQIDERPPVGIEQTSPAKTVQKTPAKTVQKTPAKKKPRHTSLTLAMKRTVATYSSIDTLLWYHEELQSSSVDDILASRLSREVPSFGYGKLMERILYAQSQGYPFMEKLIPIAEAKLRSTTLPLDRPVVVCGDASSSMKVAVETATIISSLLTALTNAELRFFTHANLVPPLQPRTIRQVLNVAQTIEAKGNTAPAACLYESYQKKEIVKFFVVVTDEEENQACCNGDRWAELFEKYRKEVSPEAQVVLVSFLRNPKDVGRMMEQMGKMEVKPLQFKLNRHKPDLTKLDAFLALMSAESQEFRDAAHDLASRMEDGGLSQVLKAVYGGRILSMYHKRGEPEVLHDERVDKANCVLS